jgi:hypothetical protein
VSFFDLFTVIGVDVLSDAFGRKDTAAVFFNSVQRGKLLVEKGKGLRIDVELVDGILGSIGQLNEILRQLTYQGIALQD